MTLKELYEKGKDAVYEALDEYLHETPELRVAYSFEDYVSEELIECPVCNEINKRSDMTYHKWDIGNVEELICEGCRENE